MLLGWAAVASASAAAASAAALVLAVLPDGVDGCSDLFTGGGRHEGLAAFDALFDVGGAEIDAAEFGDEIRRADLLESIDDGFDNVACVGGAVAFGQAVGDAGHLEDGSDDAAGDDTGTRRGGDEPDA